MSDTDTRSMEARKAEAVHGDESDNTEQETQVAAGPPRWFEQHVAPPAPSEAQQGGGEPFRRVGLVESVECPRCLFTFAAMHVNDAGREDGAPAAGQPETRVEEADWTPYMVNPKRAGVAATMCVHGESHPRFCRRCADQHAADNAPAPRPGEEASE